MNEILITDSSQFENVIQNFEKSLAKIKEIFANERRNNEEINATDTWTSSTQEVIYRKQKELEENFTPIEEGLELYISFMRKTLEDYKKLEQTINRNAENNNFQLDVNS